MSVHNSQQGETSLPELPPAVPLELPHLSQLSWELGSRVVSDEDATRHSSWEHLDAPWELSIHEVTTETILIRVRTPVGRERFYGATQYDLEAALPGLEKTAEWHQVE